MPGYIDHLTGKFVYVEDMVPEIVVPDLTDFKVCLRKLHRNIETLYSDF